MTILNHFYMTPARALELGLTHHGNAYGLPVYLADHGELAQIRAKVPLLQGYLQFADAVHDRIARWALRDEQDPDAYVEAPVSFGRRIAS